ncbi:hypothetical protein F8388_007557 [Cannabis sativa]|uniref:Uncharacterized protein n=1 Tax=Cannabis sativa TaxID=3483 RepID=A0A7J6ET07_CANSA|nr:hypothetical protein F8388_007557 [Cannabis sativa]
MAGVDTDGTPEEGCVGTGATDCGMRGWGITCSNPGGGDRLYWVVFVGILGEVGEALVALCGDEEALEGRSINGGAKWSEEKNTALLKSRSSTEIHRKLSSGTEKESARIEPHRIRGSDESANCSTLDITVSQGPTSPLPRGIPTFSVEIINNCFTGCTISNIHLKCGWFSSDNLIDPKIFKRLNFDDCLNVAKGMSLSMDEYT